MKKINKRQSLTWACLCLSLGSIGSLVFHNGSYLIGGVIVFALIFTLG